MKNRNNIRKPNPLANANIFSRGSFWWLKDFVGYGSKHDLKSDDLYDILTENKAGQLGNDLEKYWLKECEYAREKKQKPNFAKCVLKLYGTEYLKCAMIFILVGVLQMVQPLTLGMIMPYFDTPSKVSSLQAYSFASVSVSILVFTAIFRRYGYFQMCCLGMRIKIACTSLIYRKLLRLPSSSKRTGASESMINLMSNDVTQFELICCYLPFFVTIPMQAAFMLYFISQYIGITAASVAVLLLMLLSFPIQAIYYQVTKKLRAKQAAETDKRVSLISEILSAIQVIKMYAYEQYFEALVFLSRKNEIKKHLKISYITSVALSIVHYVHRWCIVFLILTCILQNSMLTSAQIIPVMQYLSTLRDNITIYFSDAIKSFADTAASIKRIEAFLVQDEVELKEKTVLNTGTDKRINIRDVTVLTNCENRNEILKNINLEVDYGKLIIVIGPVGCGKSTLLKLILGEIAAHTGDISISGKISYVSQEPWLFNGSVKDNILFGNDFDELRYKQVIRSCALLEDFTQLPYGDRTLVGEKGMSLSGGQCARINLARAVYKNADIYLLDDPLSAVDNHVSEKLFDDCIDGLLKDKTRILVTHKLTNLNRAHSVILMRDGTIQFQGSSTELKSSQLNLHDLSSNETDQSEETNSSAAKEESFSDMKDLLVQNDDKNDDPQETEEFLAKGGISKSLIPNYIKASRSYFLFFFWIFSIISIILQCAGFDYGIVIWTQQYETLFENSTKFNNGTSFNTSNTLDNSVVSLFLKIFATLVVIITVMSVLKNLACFKFMLNASKNIHDDMFTAVIKAPLKFFETNPSGRIMNRFTEDIGISDNHLPRLVSVGSEVFVETLAFLIPVLVINWWHSISMVFIGFLLFKIYNLCVPTLRGVMRLSTIAKSPVLSFAVTSSFGKETIRSHDAQEMMIQIFSSHQDEHTIPYSTYLACDSGFATYLDLMTAVLFVFVVYISIIFKSSHDTSGNIGLVLLQISNISFFIAATVRYLIFGTYGYLINIERMFQFTELEQEESTDNITTTVPKSWPTEGVIKFIDLSLKYSDESQAVLKNLNVIIESQAKIGVVGRTGAGKSSLISALFRLAKIDGTIMIDDIDTKQISLKQLRSKISIIPQEPILFSGSLRSNLDPLNEFDDAALWAAIESVELKQIFHSLDHTIEKGGSNLSLGQRQLVCLARAVVRNNKILVLDEATANVDSKTDSLIQKTLRDKFSYCTVITIAHRLNTVMDSDKILVMDGGEIVEYDHPDTLLKNSNGHFYKLANQIDIMPDEPSTEENGASTSTQNDE